MNAGQTVFRQLLQFLPRHEFNLCVRQYRGEYRARSFTAFDQFLCLAYAQLSGRALCIYLLVAIAKKKLGIQRTLYTFLQILEVNLFEKKPIFSLVAEALKQIPDPREINQLNLFNY
jgi:hypothetical protein